MYSTASAAAAAQSALNATTGDNTALASSIAIFSPSNDTLTCLAQAQILYSGEDSSAQSAALQSYNTTLGQAISGAGANNSFKVRLQLCTSSVVCDVVICMMSKALTCAYVDCHITIIITCVLVRFTGLATEAVDCHQHVSCANLGLLAA